MLYRDLKVYSFTYNPASINANTSAEETVTVTGLVAATDVVLSLTKPTATAGVGICNVRISADDTLAVTWGNATASPVNPASETYLLVVGRVGGSSISSGDRL